MLALLNPQGKKVWAKEKSTLWGLLFPNDYRKTSPLDPQLLFAGQYTDQESGLAYNRFRYYDPESGNYISSDPIGLQGGERPFGYVGNPLDWVDLFGLAGCKDVKFKRWKPSDAIDKPLPNGANPSWNTVRSRYWKNRYHASQGTGEFSASNMQRMKKGRAPLDANGNPMELHHHIPQRYQHPNRHSPNNLREVTREQHASLDPFRNLGD
ncbi:RHS repeat-associated core domain-containing protein [Pasteurella sp. PK-2025]|uniref:RHS repeat-associated core domain-containing protein n=1 Tax=Pasteurella sp. PK-2025 TaxID=3413133 RepID=UPI003C77D622